LPSRTGWRPALQDEISGGEGTRRNRRFARRAGIATFEFGPHQEQRGIPRSAGRCSVNTFGGLVEPAKEDGSRPKKSRRDDLRCCLLAAGPARPALTTVDLGFSFGNRSKNHLGDHLGPGLKPCRARADKPEPENFSVTVRWGKESVGPAETARQTPADARIAGARQSPVKYMTVRSMADCDTVEGPMHGLISVGRFEESYTCADENGRCLAST